jgi:AbrB family looped-hinge helix DNA binding protein
MTTATMSAKGWVVVPKKYREKYKLVPGTKVHFVDYDGKLFIVPTPDDPIQALRGMFAGGPSTTEELLEERQREREREDNKIERSLRAG